MATPRVRRGKGIITRLSAQNIEGNPSQMAAVRMLYMGFAHKAIEAEILRRFQAGILPHALTLRQIRYLSYEKSTIRISRYRNMEVTFARSLVSRLFNRHSIATSVTRCFSNNGE